MVKHLCEFPGCQNTINHGRYCSEHGYTSKFKRSQQKARSVYHHDNKPVYHSSEWESICQVVDLREHNQCQRCGKIVFGRHKHHHHIIPIKQDPSLWFEPNNIMLLCDKCHPIVEHEQELNPPKVFPAYFKAPPTKN